MQATITFSSASFKGNKRGSSSTVVGELNFESSNHFVIKTFLSEFEKHTAL